MKNLAIFIIVIPLVVFAGGTDAGSSSNIYKGIASWYSEEDPGILETTADMERFDDSEFTCAMWDLPFDTIVKVTNLENGRSIFVRVNDRGPAKRFVQKHRIIDLTKSAFARIADLKKGLIRVTVEII